LSSRAEHRDRMERLRNAIGQTDLDGVVIVPGPNMRYYTGVNSFLLERPFLLLVPGEGEARLVAPAIEAGPYRDSSLDIKVEAWTDSEGPSEAIGRAVSGLRTKRWGVEGRAPFQYISVLGKRMHASLEDAEPTLQGQRAVKDDNEVRLMKKSARILSAVIAESPGLVRSGMTELDLAAKIADLIRARGALSSSDLLVQSGVRAANPHSIASKKKIRVGEPIVLDLVSNFEGYHADITRTIAVGNVPGLEELYEKVLSAQSKAIAAAARGVAVGEVDKAARDELKRSGLARYFTHRTGHGLGLEEHEAPYIVDGGKQRLEENMFFTVEPGAYMSGRIGVRIEDDIRVEGSGVAAITDPPKEFGWWK